MQKTYWERSETSDPKGKRKTRRTTELARILREAEQELQSLKLLRQNEEHFRQMVEGSERVLFYTHGRDHMFGYLSPSSREVLGYEPEELAGKPGDLLVRTISNLALTMNISAKTLRDQQFVERMLSQCEEHGISPDRMILELTETSAMENRTASLDLLTRLRMKGFHVAAGSASIYRSQG